MTRGRQLPLGAALPLLAVLACSRGGDKDGVSGAQGSRSTGTALAQVNDAKLTEADLQRLIPAEFREALTGSEIRDIMDRWMRTELLYQKAKRDGLDRDPEVAMRLRDNERDLLADEQLQRELQQRVQVSAAEIQSYFQQHQPEYTQELHLKHIVLNTRQEAESVLQQLRGGAVFELMAQQHSVDASGAKGGDLGYLGKAGINPAFKPQVFTMQVGDVAGPIASSFGFHILKLVDRRASAEPVPFDSVRDEIMHNLLLQKQQHAVQEILKGLRDEAKVQMASTYAGMALAPSDSMTRATASEPTASEPSDEPGSNP